MQCLSFRIKARSLDFNFSTERNNGRNSVIMGINIRRSLLLLSGVFLCSLLVDAFPGRAEREKEIVDLEENGELTTIKSLPIRVKQGVRDPKEDHIGSWQVMVIVCSVFLFLATFVYIMYRCHSIR